MRFISSRRFSHCATAVTLVPSFIVNMSGISVRIGRSFTPGSVPIAVLIGGKGISRGSGPVMELEDCARAKITAARAHKMIARQVFIRIVRGD